MSKSKKAAKSTIVGRYFHSFPNGVLTWQGRILTEQAPGIFLVQLYEWLVGTATDTVLIPIQRMVDERWDFYLDQQEWKAAVGQ